MPPGNEEPAIRFGQRVLERSVANVPPVQEDVLKALRTAAQIGKPDEAGCLDVFVFAFDLDETRRDVGTENAPDSLLAVVGRGKIVNRSAVVL